MDSRLEEAIALLSSLLGETPSALSRAMPWERPLEPVSTVGSRISATDRLSWWFRPSAGGHDAWDSYFEPVPTPTSGIAPSPTARPAAPAEPLGRRAALRLLLDEPDEEMVDSDADAVVSCLYDFVHAFGRGDVTAAIDECVDPEYHTIENDVEVDRDGLAAQLHAELQPLRGWDIDASLVEIPAPILHPGGILVYTELQLEATCGDARRTIIHRRLAVFRQGRDRRWRIAALSPV